VIEIFEVRFIDGIADDFDIEVIEIRRSEAVSEVGSCVLKM
jgi:hypothetical protein